MSEVYLVNKELYHHGIKGMKWGVRRFQKKDGSLTPAGKKRYSDTTEGRRLKKEMDVAKKARDVANKEFSNASSNYMYIPTKSNKKAFAKASHKTFFADESYRQAKLKYDAGKEAARLRDSNIEIKDKSKHRQKLEQRYREMGLDEEQAQAAANKRIKTEKLIAASATVAVSACALYVANEQRKQRVDSFIKAGEALQRIEMKDTEGKLHDVFFVAKGKHDIQRYERMLGATRQRQTGKAWMMKLEASKDIKVASREHAAKAFEDLLKNDPEFKRAAAKYISRNAHGGNQVDLSNLSRRNIRKMYENFNTNIVDKSMAEAGISKKFYDKLKSQGYGAIQDINDMKFSGYNAKNPLIVFDNAHNNIMVKSFKEMEGDLMPGGVKEQAKAAAEKMTEEYLKQFGVMSATALTYQAVRSHYTNPTTKYYETKFVEQYLKDHPNTTKTYSEIVRMRKKK